MLSAIQIAHPPSSSSPAREAHGCHDDSTDSAIQQDTPLGTRHSSVANCENRATVLPGQTMSTPPSQCVAEKLHGPSPTNPTTTITTTTVTTTVSTTKAEQRAIAGGDDAPCCSARDFSHTAASLNGATTNRNHGSVEHAPTKEQLAAATKIQAAIRGYNTRRDLFAGPILTSLQKWKYLCLYTRLNTRVALASTISDNSVMNYDAKDQQGQQDQQDQQDKPNSPQEKNARLWTRMMFLTSQLGKGFSAAPSEEALVLLTEHWLEMSDKKHRYGSNLKPYHEYWLKQTTNQDFFDWLDYGEGKDLSLEERPRSRLETELVQYLQEHEREQYAVTAKDGLLYYRESGKLVHTLPESIRAGDDVDVSQILPDADANDDEETRLEKKRLRNRAKYIYVMDPKGVLYIARKVKGKFHHSSFFGGGTVCAAGGIIVNRGRLVKINPKSGHYRPGQTHFDRLLRTLHEMGIPLDNVKISTTIFEQAGPSVDG